MGMFRNRFVFFAACLIFIVPNYAAAQFYPTSDQLLPVATINQERLFAESKYGKQFNQKFKNDANILSEDNRLIEKELTDEEIALTEKRKVLPNDEFRKLAGIFNEKVETIRRDQTQKQKDLNTAGVQVQRVFFSQVQPIIIQLMQERGIQYILNEKSIFMSTNSGDITDSVIKRIDQALEIPSFLGQK